LSEAKEFFAEEMPTGKEWKRKASNGQLFVFRHIFPNLLMVIIGIVAENHPPPPKKN